MSKQLQVQVGSLCDMGDRFVSAFNRAANGQKVNEQHLSFLSYEALTATLTGKRLELLRQLKQQPSPSILALSKTLARDYRRVHADVSALEAAGLIIRKNDFLTVPWKSLRADLQLA